MKLQHLSIAGAVLALLFAMPAGAQQVLDYTGDKFPRWKGNLLVGSLNGQSVQRVAFNQPSQAERREPLLRTLCPAVCRISPGPQRS